MSEKIAANLLDAEIKRKAKGMIRKAYDSIGGLNEHKDLQITESKSGEIEFHYLGTAIFGNVNIIYSPQPFVEKLLKDYADAFEKKLDQKDFQSLPPELSEDLAEEAIFNITKIIVINLLYECPGFSADQSMMAMQIYTFLNPEILSSAETLIYRTDAERKELIAGIFQKLNKRRREIILNLEKQTLEQISAPQFIFCDIYDIHHKVWRKVKKIYTKTKTLPGALDILKRAFPNLDPDLIDKFALRGESEPKALAFESASRYLNISPGRGLSESSRKNYLKESREQRKNISVDAAEAAYKKYVLAWESHYQTEERRRQILDSFLAKTSH